MSSVFGIAQLRVVYKEWTERNVYVEVMLHDQLIVMGSINDLTTISGETTKPYDRPSDLLLGKVEKDDNSDPEI